MGMKYVFDETSPTGWKPVRASGPDQTTPTLNADPAFVEDFENPSRPFFGDDQLAWFVNELKKPADLRLVFNGGPNFEIDYSYASLTDVPGAKRRFVEALREANVEKIVFFAGDSHATYVTKVPDLLAAPVSDLHRRWVGHDSGPLVRSVCRILGRHLAPPSRCRRVQRQVRQHRFLRRGGAPLRPGAASPLHPTPR
mmetsp:Transcript_48527/g.161907  ORF Transcript_48527/g.161907 Transcript_48527/m.161907 type:complete len:197 (+) Transcript_48527:922-1512(+)